MATIHGWGEAGWDSHVDHRPERDNGDLNPIIAERLFEWLEKTGMITISDGHIKSSWPVFLDALEAAQP